MIAAEGEQKASRALREAAAVIAESPSALQVLIDCITGDPSLVPMSSFLLLATSTSYRRAFVGGWGQGECFSLLL